MRKIEGSSIRAYTRKLLVKVGAVWVRTKRSVLFFVSLALLLSPLAVLGQTVQAAQITSRSLAITSAVPSATTTYTFNFTPGTAAVLAGVTIQLCDSAVGGCTGGTETPTGVNIQQGSITTGGGGLTNFEGTFTTGPAQDKTTTTPVDCTQLYDYCITFANSSSQTVTNHTITISGVLNPSTIGTFYARITTYTTAYSGVEDTGNVAAATTQTFTVNAIVQEQLNFCVGAVNGTAATVEVYNATIPLCSAMTGNSLTLGTLSSVATSVSPVPSGQPTNGDGNSGVAELMTNAANGTVVSYSAVAQAAGTGNYHPGALRVPGATCTSGTSYTVQCFASQDPTGKITPGTEAFGMTIPGVNCYNVPSGAYTCNQTTHNLTVNSNYDCAAGDLTSSFSVTDEPSGGQITGSTQTNCNYMWDEATSDVSPIASSSSVVGNEALILEFAATPELTTPTGAYSAQASFQATPTF